MAGMQPPLAGKEAFTKPHGISGLMSRAPKLQHQETERVPQENHRSPEIEMWLGYLLNNNRAKGTVEL